MKVLRPGVDLDAFFDQLRDVRQCVLLMGYDGTLAAWRDDPQPEPCRLLDGILRDGRTRVILVSGRWTRDLLPLPALSRTPELWGSHGRERRFPDGRHETATPDETALRGLAEADTWIEEIIALGGSAEPKPAGLAIHWRGLAHAQATQVRDLVRENWAMLARESGLALHEFDGGIELRVPGCDKGHAVNTVLNEMPVGTMAAYLGNDVSDEDAFRALRGRGLRVLVRADFRASGADLWITPARDLTAFLSRWRDIRRVPETINEMA
jgi:trehalose-phosphatase